MKSVLQAQVGQTLGQRQGVLTLRYGAPRQGLMEVVGPGGGGAICGSAPIIGSAGREGAPSINCHFLTVNVAS